MFPELGSKGVVFHAFKCTLWATPHKCKVWSPASKAKSVLVQLEMSCSTWDDLKKNYLLRYHIDLGCYPNPHLYCTMQLTKHLLEIDHLIFGFWERFAKSMVSVVHWGCGVQGCLGKRSHREELSFVKLKVGWLHSQALWCQIQAWFLLDDVLTLSTVEWAES